MKTEVSYKIESVKYGYRSQSAKIFWVKAKSKKQAIDIAKTMLEAGFVIERVYRPRAFNLEQ